VGIFGKLFGGDKASREAQELLTLKSKISELCPAPLFNPKTGKVEDPIPAICGAIDLAVKSLETGTRAGARYTSGYSINYPRVYTTP
jgi:hypothetical protein